MYYGEGNMAELEVPRTKTSTALEVSPGPSGEYGVHVYLRARVLECTCT